MRLTGERVLVTGSTAGIGKRSQVGQVDPSACRLVVQGHLRRDVAAVAGLGRIA